MDKLITILFSLLLITTTNADNRYWIGSGTSTWNDVNNWSDVSGGLGGFSVPSALDDIFFDNKGLADVLLDANYEVASVSIDANYTGTIDFNGFTLTVSGAGDIQILGGTLDNGSLVVNDADRDLLFRNTMINVDVVASSGKIYYSGATFGETVSFTLTGVPVNPHSNGSSTFKKAATFIHNSSGYWEIASNQTNLFEGDVRIENNDTGTVMLVKVGTTTIKGDLTYLSTTSGAVSSSLLSVNNIDAKFTIEGNVLLETQSSADDELIKFPVNGQITIDQNLTVRNSATSDQSLIYLSGNAKSKITVNGNLLIENDGLTGTKKEVRFPDKGEAFVFGTSDIQNTSTANQNLIVLGKSGDATFHQAVSITNNAVNTKSEVVVAESGQFIFNGDVHLINNATANSSWIEVSKNSGTTVAFNGNVILENTSTNSDYIRFGAQGGTSTLADTKVIQIKDNDPSNYQTDLSINNLTQNGTTTQQLSISNALLTVAASTFNGNITLEAPEILVSDSHFYGETSITQSGSNNLNSTGNNQFYENTTIRNTGTGTLRTANNNGNIYHKDVTYQTTSTGTIEETSVSKTEYKGDVYLNTTSVVELARGVSGVVEFNGTSNQSIIDLSGSSSARISSLIVNTDGELTVSVPTIVRYQIDFTKGLVNTDIFNTLELSNGGVVANVSTTSHVVGPFTKVGLDAFTFPLGDATALHPIGISAPPTSNSRFTAEFYAGSSGLEDKELGIENVSTCEYWKLTNTQGHAVNVDITWDDCSDIGDYTTLGVGRYVSGEWVNYGNAELSGDEAAQRVTSSLTLSNLEDGENYITFVTADPSNDLPVELIDFGASKESNTVKLSWSTATEINNDRFVLSKSTDRRNWQEIGEVKGAGNSQTLLHYKFFDDEPITGTVFYQLKQINFDGTEEIFPSIRLQSNDNDIYLYAYPNPFQHQFTIESNDLDPFQLFDMMGREVTESVVEISSSENKITLEAGMLENGVYFLKTRLGKVVRVVKK
ncbi:T9SS type A sorting domain-containing protein [Flammeovirga yaeyamensis]|uniref:T9SS type A sorting domain-containing protein n=1 Tax=Flammeovirga yaeyamensis TaxID=367791 RepID=A0AAX1N3B0_9BACT|nr:T9SS type A sorting domain-containing protein [Flammeovirga yaeyamensis]MBB3695919.1 hypothetical protein [Flammeovirga yaeyamensis]NMF34608.1 T9SS type A sorting domain-containing protein [Flammeovirga yaeyamensis]QWG00562.1 T9SS type A sorting domain-containing protein [Flammeovirga yaeyamensis]